jgi:hypothetical protein
MVWTRIKLTAAAVLAVTLAGTGAVFTGRPAAVAQDEAGAAAAPRPRPVAGPATEGATASDAKARAASRENLKRIALAMHEYASQHGNRLPAPAIYGKDKKPLLSWRVAILPFLDQNNLYRQFHLDEPWDSPHNKTLAEIQVKTYMPVGGVKAPVGSTYYQVFVGKGAAFEAHKQMDIPASFPDGTSDTILVVEAGKPVPWTKPEDIDYPEDRPLPPLGGLFKDVFQAAFVDGSTYTLKKKCDERILRIAILRDDGTPYDRKKLLAERPAPFSARDPWYLRFLSAARRGEVQRQREMVEALQRERDALKAAREKAAREKDKASPAPDLAALERENQRLLQEVRKLRDQAAALREEIQRLKQLPEKPSAPKR